MYSLKSLVSDQEKNEQIDKLKAKLVDKKQMENFISNLGVIKKAKGIQSSNRDLSKCYGSKKG
jgi:hypothetical protein